MKRTINRQLALVFSITMAGVIMLCLLVNYLFLGKVYTANKRIALENAYRQIDEATKLGDVESEAFDIQFRQIASKNNLEILVLDSETETLKTTVTDVGPLSDSLLGYLFRGDEKAEVIANNDHYRVQKIADPIAGMDYIELWGTLSTGSLIVMRSPLESIRESASISNNFFIIVGAIAILISAIVIMIISKTITKPIEVLTEISSKMAGLDFATKYTVRPSGNELDVLGQNFNQMSDTLEKTIKELKDANAELTQDIKRKTEIEEMRKEFLSNVSHELKTPIALVQGYAEGLKDCVNDDADSRDYYCDVIIDEAAKMNQIVKNLLQLDQLENGREDIILEEVDLTELVESCIKSVDILIKQNNINLEYHYDGRIFAKTDEFKLGQILNNYLTNAIHYVDENKKIEVTITVSDDNVRVSIYNSGEQIPDESLPKLWDKFYKVDKARCREYGGSGIGLSIVKALAEQLKLGYGARNRENGVEFWVEIRR